MIRLIPAGASKILEIGCGAGMTGKLLKELGFEEIVGIEVVEEVARKAIPYYDRVIVGDVEKVMLPYEKGHFDCILYGDVLEHLVEPWRVLKEHNALLKPGGTIVCSIPNIRHYRITRRLLFKGKWEYQESGILDRTHLRFFTLASMKNMVTDSGFEITTIIKKPSAAKWLKWLNRLLGNALIDHLVRRYLFSARKKEA
jgi:2-polyprenyl-3-methyl-5-hydroxy-6-metoxy-1,4-benzoquinol methylase